MSDDACIEQTRECVVELVPVHAERAGHSISTVEGGASSIGGNGEQDEDRGGIRPELGEPACVQ